MVISGETRARIDTEIAKYPKKRGALLPALHLVQEQTGWIAPEAARELATIFDLHPIEVMEVVSFYNMFYDHPQGRHHVHVCTNLPCSLRGSRDLLRQLEQHLGIEAGETTKDGRVTLGQRGMSRRLRLGAGAARRRDLPRESRRRRRQADRRRPRVAPCRRFPSSPAI